MCYYWSSKPPVPANLHARQVFISQNISSSSSSKTSCTVKFACKYTPPIQSNSFLKISGLFETLTCIPADLDASIKCTLPYFASRACHTSKYCFGRSHPLLNPQYRQIQHYTQLHFILGVLKPLAEFFQLRTFIDREHTNSNTFEGQ